MPELLRISWRAATGIPARLVAEGRAGTDALHGPRRIGIGIDEVAHRKGQRYLTVVVDHGTGRLVCPAPAATRPP